MIEIRPREKLATFGAENLSFVELLQLIIGSGSKTVPLKKVARNVLKKHSARSLENAALENLTEIKGLGVPQASKLIASVELGRRIFAAPQTTTIMTSDDVFKASQNIKNSKREHLLALYLNARQELIKQEVISIGGTNYINVHPRDVFSTAVQLPATFVVIVHNHPSGNCTPSQDDLAVTERLTAAGELLGIEVLDHLVVTKTNYYSFREKGLL